MSGVIDLAEERDARFADDALTGFEDLPPIMSPAQLADVLDVSVRTLERWRVGGDGPEYLHPNGTRVYRYYRRDVLAWLENKKHGAATPSMNINI